MMSGGGGGTPPSPVAMYNAHLYVQPGADIVDIPITSGTLYDYDAHIDILDELRAAYQRTATLEGGYIRVNVGVPLTSPDAVAGGGLHICESRCESSDNWEVDEALREDDILWISYEIQTGSLPEPENPSPLTIVWSAAQDTPRTECSIPVRLTLNGFYA